MCLLLRQEYHCSVCKMWGGKNLHEDKNHSKKFCKITKKKLFEFKKESLKYNRHRSKNVVVRLMLLYLYTQYIMQQEQFNGTYVYRHKHNYIP